LKLIPRRLMRYISLVPLSNKSYFAISIQHCNLALRWRAERSWRTLKITTKYTHRLTYTNIR
jgi:hypothetical protein